MARAIILLLYSQLFYVSGQDLGGGRVNKGVGRAEGEGGGC